MRLTTLGVLELPGDNYSSEKPLLLLAYLAHNRGTWLRNEALTELIWSGATDPAHSLNVAVSSLRTQTSAGEHVERKRGIIRVDSEVVTTDAQELLRACEDGDLKRVETLYGRGQFLQATDPDDYPDLFEQWIAPEQRKIRAAVWRAFLSEVNGQQSDEQNYLYKAHALTQAIPPPESRQFTTLFALLKALKKEGGPTGQVVAREVEEYDVVDLPTTPQEARDFLGWSAPKASAPPERADPELEPVKLRTLGALELTGSDFTQQRPLFLLAYLSVAGRQTRRRVAELLWPRGKDPRNNLSRLLKDLRKSGLEGEGFWADDDFVESHLPTDLAEFQAAYRSKNYQKAVDLYRGTFLETVDLSKNAELEEWLFETREVVARQAQEAMLKVAEAEAQKGAFSVAARWAEKAFKLLTDSEPETLRRIYTFLVAGESALAPQVQQGAADYGVELNLSKEEARSSFQRTFVGRKAELRQLSELRPGSFAWICGATGMGKTALLESLAGTYLPARSGLPYATLEPLLENTVQENEELMLRKLLSIQDIWLLDDWEKMDAESRRLFERLRDLKPQAQVIITSREAPPFGADVQLELKPLSEEDLVDYPGTWETTKGLPALVGAYLRDEPLDAVLQNQLDGLSENAKQVYLAMGMLEQPDLVLVRQALGLSAADMAQSVDRLKAVGLVSPTGELRLSQIAQDDLKTQVNADEQLALKLARQLEGVAAFPFYAQARLFWEEEDFLAVRKAYMAWADELLRRGAPQRASEVLEAAPESEEVVFLRAQALEVSGRYREALELVERLKETPNMMALRGALYWRLGRHEEARKASEEALDGDNVARAEAFNTLGHLARDKANYQQAIKYARRSASLWKALNRKEDLGGALNNIAVALVLAEEKSEEAFQQAFDVAGENMKMRALVLLNLGWFYERSNNLDEAELKYREAAELSKKSGALNQAAQAHNNIGVVYHIRQNLERAREEYEEALAFAQQAGQPFTIFMTIVNLAELNEDIEAWEEALFQLKEAGHESLVKNYRDNLNDDHPFKKLQGESVNSEQPLSKSL